MLQIKRRVAAAVEGAGVGIGAGRRDGRRGAFSGRTGEGDGWWGVVCECLYSMEACVCVCVCL